MTLLSSQCAQHAQLRTISTTFIVIYFNKTQNCTLSSITFLPEIRTPHFSWYTVFDKSRVCGRRRGSVDCRRRVIGPAAGRASALQYRACCPFNSVAKLSFLLRLILTHLNQIRVACLEIVCSSVLTPWFSFPCTEFVLCLCFISACGLEYFVDLEYFYDFWRVKY